MIENDDDDDDGDEDNREFLPDFLQIIHNCTKN